MVRYINVIEYDENEKKPTEVYGKKLRYQHKAENDIQFENFVIGDRT